MNTIKNKVIPIYFLRVPFLPKNKYEQLLKRLGNQWPTWNLILIACFPLSIKFNLLQWQKNEEKMSLIGVRILTNYTYFHKRIEFFRDSATQGINFTITAILSTFCHNQVNHFISWVINNNKSTKRYRALPRFRFTLIGLTVF